MQKFNSSGVEIAYDVAGEGPPVLLVHGYASNSRINWGETGWVRFLTEAGRSVITFDHRGHGESEKLYDSTQYSAMIMAADANRLLAHLGIAHVDVIGYSMGARVTAFMLINHPDKVRRAVLGGLAERMIAGVPGSDAIAAAMEAEDLSTVTDLGGRAFRIFAMRTGGDLKALAACIRSSRVSIKTEALAQIKAPVMVVAGDKDELAGDIQPLVDAIPGAVGLSLPGKDHMSAVGDLQFKREALRFLDHIDVAVRTGKG
jgi:pimeloyl-ACP methyl ester carboxylesterase